MNAVTKGNMSSVTIITNSADRYTANGSIKLNQWMGAVVSVGRKCFAFCTEVDIMTHRTFVTSPSYITGKLAIFAKRAIAKYSVMNFIVLRRLRDRLVDRYEAMARVSLWGIWYTFHTVIPIWTGQTFVTYANDALNCKVRTFHSC